VDVLTFVKRECRDELKRLGRELHVPGTFPVYESGVLEKEYGAEFEKVASLKADTPFWITGHLREFYDRQDPLSGKHINYDLIYPEGFGEALSGGEREYEYSRIVEKMKERKTDLSSFEPYLEAARSGALVPSAGGGFGVERMVRYLTGRKHVSEVVLFPRIPGEEIIF
jgi:asparaginyl-tRNA synthetase